MTKSQGSIRTKLTLIIFFSAFVILILDVGITYFLGFNTFSDTLGNEYVQISQLLATYITKSLNGEIEDIKTYATRPLWIDDVKQANLKCEGQNAETAKRRFAEMDKKWSEAPKDAPLIKEYLENRAAISMREILKIRKNVAQIFITDRCGGLVASSDKISNFYQADKEWWQEAYNSGKGKIYVGNIEFDGSSGYWVLPVAAPIKDEKGDVVGICKEGISIERLFGHLADFKIGKTGHAVLVDQDGTVIYHKNIMPGKIKYSAAIDFPKLLISKKSYRILLNPHTHAASIFTAFSDIKLPFQAKKEIVWRLFIDQDAAETFEPLNKFVFHITTTGLILMITIIPIGYILGGLFTKPILKLREATERVVAGDWDYTINVKTGDEIEEFAEAFKAMISNIKTKQRELLITNEKLEDLSKNLEKKVDARTAELTQAQEATLNILEDLTEAKKRLEKEAKALEEALRIKSDFTSTISHELRTPLAAIKESIAIVSDGIAGPVGEEQKEFLEMARRNIDRLNRLINDILDFQKFDAGKIVFTMRENNINDAVKETAKTMALLAQEKGLDFMIDTDDDIPQIKFDKDRIMQVLTNLAGNAIKFTEKGGVTITTKTQGNAIEVSVEDTGPGIKKEDMPKLFLLFEQLEKGPDRKTGGTGLGLAISKEIIERHNGKIWAESELGKGSTFRFILPMKEYGV